MSTGFIVLGHGSKVHETVGMLQDITNSLKRQLQLDNVIYATLQFNEPTLPQAIDILAGDGIDEIIILPFFLIEGNHMKQDIPEIIEAEKEKFPGVDIQLVEHIGADLRIVDILADKARAAVEVSEDYDHAKLHEPVQIEEESFRIIESSTNLHDMSAGQRAVMQRIIHASGDLSLAGAIDISDGAIEAGIQALQKGCPIITDVRMAATGINKKLAAVYGNQIMCKVDDPLVAEEAAASRKTRSAVAMRGLVNHVANSIVVIGNAPTALFELLSMVREGYERPALVIGTPVGFVGAAESKEALARSGLNYITVRGTRGGSAMAVAAANAILKLATSGR